ncbi:alkaline phosphatase PhoX [Methylomonas methanica]|uniref:Phosphatase n=1 Tax=Methylomonas methanica TaxID=421 RepID=A0A177M8G1_METMH|nr:alkaline phosphatase PhoX [Methylomonas methanica]OAI01824.1 phosphatase [Methylomonas methanica]OAI05214.1 phosphatase [Methylomonas methanica]
MKAFKLTLIAAAVTSVVSPLTAQAADTLFDNFTPLTSSAGPIPVGSAGEATPITLSSPNFTQVSIADRTTHLAQGQGDSGNWDMITANETGPDAGRYLFMPYETGTGGVQRIDLHDSNYNTRTTTIVAPGTLGFVAGDASRWTPWGTYLTAEESWSDPAQAASPYGRLFEVTNPTTAGVNGGNFVQRKIGPADIRVSHEGLAFDAANNFYFIDERDDSHIFKFTSANPNATNGDDFFGAGLTSVLRVGDGTVQEAEGAYSWIDLTDLAGNALAGTVVKTDPNGMTVLDGRATPNVSAFLGTNFDRPEDLEIHTLDNGDQLLYVATTTNNKVFSLNLANNNIKLFASQATTDLATGNAAGTGFRNPDNLAVDAEGNIYIIEDRNGGVDDDIWFAKDLNNDGDLLDAGEGLARWASNGTQGSEFTGLYFDKFNPNVAYVNIQHPSSGNDRTMQINAVPVPGAVWLFGSAIAGMIGLRRRKA